MSHSKLSNHRSNKSITEESIQEEYDQGFDSYSGSAGKLNKVKNDK